MPVILAVYDAPNDTTYWLHVQEYFESQRTTRFDEPGTTITAHIPRTNVVNPAAMRQFAALRDRILAQIGGSTRYD